MKKNLFALSVLALLTGCSSMSSVEPETKDDPLEDFDVGSLDFDFGQAQGGSIYSNGSNSLLMGAGKSFQVGDIVNVEMSEEIDAEDSISSSMTQKSTNKTDIGLTIAPTTGVGTDGEVAFDFTNDKKVDGDGSSSQSHKIEGSIACTVTKTFANGVLEIKGKKIITLEKGSETVAIYGYIREQDISTTTNTIPSSRIANAKIYYKGEGVLYEKSSEGWLSSIIGGKYWAF
ncbi:flagellar basal body L-ring protein FlgH [Vibrio crassostreae]|uniref:flagellar basal body L-ring protein FlgH n=1 Tax=Vibrio crassostreae TaxID=246167 RepID=UPI001B309143|nr:flagellar basal body L-ring protein FlgH [Vibrio crassostreae]